MDKSACRISYLQYRNKADRFKPFLRHRKYDFLTEWDLDPYHWHFLKDWECFKQNRKLGHHALSPINSSSVLKSDFAKHNMNYSYNNTTKRYLVYISLNFVTGSLCIVSLSFISMERSRVFCKQGRAFAWAGSFKAAAFAKDCCTHGVFPSNLKVVV